jgi:hypothetical protein
VWGRHHDGAFVGPAAFVQTIELDGADVGLPHLGTMQVLERHRCGLTRQLNPVGSGQMEMVDVSTPWGCRLVAEDGTWVDGQRQGAVRISNLGVVYHFENSGLGAPRITALHFGPPSRFLQMHCGVKAWAPRPADSNDFIFDDVDPFERFNGRGTWRGGAGFGSHTYHGEVRNGLMHGRGALTYADGSKMTGSFMNCPPFFPLDFVPFIAHSSARSSFRLCVVHPTGSAVLLDDSNRLIRR